MNRQRRGELAKAKRHLDLAVGILENVIDAEQDSMDNIPENLQFSDRFERMEAIVSELEDICADAESVSDRLSTIEEK